MAHSYYQDDEYDLKDHASIKPSDRQELNKSYDVLKAEVRDFWHHRYVSCMTRFNLGFLTLCNIMTIVLLATPSWGRTREIIGQGGRLEGEIYGFYGVWYSCFETLDLSYDYYINKRYCVLWADAIYIPSWWGAFQAMMTCTFIFGFFAFIVIGLYIFVVAFNRHLKLMVAYIIFSLLSATFCTIGMIVFCVLFLKETFWCCHPDLTREMVWYRLNWGFYMGCAVTVCYYLVVAFGAFEAANICRDERAQWEYEESLRRKGLLVDDQNNVPLVHGQNNGQPLQ